MTNESKNPRKSPARAPRSLSSRIFSALIVVSLMAIPARAAAAQGETPSAVQGPTSRAELEQSLASWDSLAAEGYQHAAREASTIRRRLAEGDFRTGDRIALTIINSTSYPTNIVEQFLDTLTVLEGGTLMLPMAGATSLQGVLRTELNAHLTRELSRVLRDPPRIATTITIPVGVSGAVGQQGFFSYAPSARIQEVIMRSSPAGNANLNKIVVKRNNREIVGADRLRAEIARGATLEQLDIRAGDEFAVAERSPPFGWRSVVGISTAVLSLVWAVDQVFGR